MTKPKKQPLALKGANLELNTLKNKSLSVQLSLDGFSFCISDVFSETILALYHYPFKARTPEELLTHIKTIFNSSELLKTNFKNVQVCHVNNLATLVPKSLFNKEHLAAYLGYLVKTLKNDYYDYDSIEALEAVNIYIPFVNANNFFIDKFGSFTFNHFSSLFIKHLLTTVQKSSEVQMFTHVATSHFEVAVIKNQSLLLYNSFSYQTKEDFIYYLLFVAEQLKLNTETFKLYLLGDITSQDERFTITYKYVKNVALYSYNLSFKADFPLSDKQKRCFLTLLQPV
jgi:Protein of unknown function (DUF3822)